MRRSRRRARRRARPRARARRAAARRCGAARRGSPRAAHRRARGRLLARRGPRSDRDARDEHPGRSGAPGAREVARELVGELREAIRGGRLRTGVRLPASRALAAELGVSRGVVTDAYEQLTAEGWLAARRGAGTTVAAAPAAEPPRSTAPGRAAVRFDFTATTPDV